MWPELKWEPVSRGRIRFYKKLLPNMGPLVEATHSERREACPVPVVSGGVRGGACTPLSAGRTPPILAIGRLKAQLHEILPVPPQK